jgi:hypothetical protein
MAALPWAMRYVLCAMHELGLGMSPSRIPIGQPIAPAAAPSKPRGAPPPRQNGPPKAEPRAKTLGQEARPAGQQASRLRARGSDMAFNLWLSLPRPSSLIAVLT